MRYTIQGHQARNSRRYVRLYQFTGVESWAIARRAARLDHGRPVHQDRVRFGAWEERPTADVSYVGQERAIAMLFEGNRAEYEAAAHHTLTAFGPYAGRWDVSDYEVSRLARTFAHLDWSAGGR